MDLYNPKHSNLCQVHVVEIGTVDRMKFVIPGVVEHIGCAIQMIPENKKAFASYKVEIINVE